MIHTHCDRMAADAAKPRTTGHPAMVLATTILASSLAFVDGSVVNVALPAIGESLKGGAADLQWVVNAYLLPLSALLLLGGAAGDRFGRRRVMVAGIMIFAAASLVCALAPGLGLLLAGRVLLGVGAAMLMPNSLALLGGAFDGEARGRAIGTWAAAGAVAGAAGPLIGGWLIDTVGWRSIFLINLPVAAGAIILALRYVSGAKPDGKHAPLDGWGAALATLGLGALTWGLTIGSGPAGWTPSALITTLVGAVMLLAFVWAEKKQGDQAMMPLALFGSAQFAGLSLLTLLLYGALGGLLVLLPYLLIRVEHYSGTAAGAALLPFPLLLAVISPLMGGIAGRIGSRIPLTVGPIVVACGLILAMRIGGGGSYWSTVLPAILVISLGMAGAVAPLTTAVLSSVDARHTGSASGFNSALARTGGMVATALLGAVLAAQGEALVSAFRSACMIGALACVAAGLSALFTVDGRPKTANGDRA